MHRFTAVLTSNRPPTEQEALGIRQLIHELDSQPGENSEPPSSASNELGELRHLMLISLRGVLSPIRCVPAEILSEIFIASRDDSLDSEPEYEITSPNFAPILLTRVCSRWRMVALCTPRLWNNVELFTDAFVDGRQMLIKEILDRSCRAPLCITLANPPDWSMMGMGGGNRERRWLDIIWDCSHRLRHISLDVCPDDARSQMFPRHTIFPQLSSLEILVDGDDELDMYTILDSFASAPLLRSLTLDLLGLDSEALFPATFPSSQLTMLNIDAAVTTFGARDILLQCAALETARLHSLFDCDPDEPSIWDNNCTLRHLFELDIAIGEGTGLADILDIFTLPKLTSLSIESNP
ncbi:hypothetical protein DFH06DRAFT_1411856, partial [Mycena polygramma]